jgi:chromosome segregation ATPase
MSFIKGALDALNNLFETIFSRLDALGDRTEVLESDFEKFALSLEEAATHAAQYALEVKLDDLGYDEDLKEDLVRLADKVGDAEQEARDYFCRVESLEAETERLECERGGMQSELYHLENELKALKAAHAAQAETINALLKALEWQPPKD